MADAIQFGFMERVAEIDQSHRNLPHWFQPGVAVFLTFRTADSLPRDVVLRWNQEQIGWLRQQGWSADACTPPSVDDVPTAFRNPYRTYRNRRWHWHLDTCHGECPLRKRELAEIVLKSLRHFDGDRYDLDSLIVMPNHVHLLVQFRPPTTCRKQCESWLHYTAREINKRLGRRGAFWQSEPFDHLVRSPEQFAYLRRYIADNGRNANLPPTDYLYWSRSGI